MLGKNSHLLPYYSEDQWLDFTFQKYWHMFSLWITVIKMELKHKDLWMKSHYDMIFYRIVFMIQQLRLELQVTKVWKRLPAMQETQVWFLGQEDPQRRGWQPTPVFLPGESHGQRSPAGYSPWDHKVRHSFKLTGKVWLGGLQRRGLVLINIWYTELLYIFMNEVVGY